MKPYYNQIISFRSKEDPTQPPIARNADGTFGDYHIRVDYMVKIKTLEIYEFRTSRGQVITYPPPEAFVLFSFSDIMELVSMVNPKLATTLKPGEFEIIRGMVDKIIAG